MRATAKRLAVLMAIAVGALWVPAGAWASVSISGHVDGTVSGGSQPLEGVTIFESLDSGASWFNTGITTDASGNYSGVSAPAAIVELRFSHPWYQDNDVTVDLSSNTTGTTTVNATQTQDGALRGHVSDASTGLPLAGITVQITSPGPDPAQAGCPSTGSCTYAETTDQNGNWTDEAYFDGGYQPADVPSSGWTICAPQSATAGYVQQCTSGVDVSNGSPGAEVDFMLSATRSLRITTEDNTTGDYVSGVVATVYNGAGSAIGHCTTSAGGCTATVTEADSYRIGFGASAGYPAQYYNLKSGLNCADPVAVGASGADVLAYLASSSTQLTACSGGGGSTATTPTTTPTPSTTTTTPGGGGGATPPLAPVLSGASEQTMVWREGSALAVFSRAQAPIGTTFSFALNEPATVIYTFDRTAGGRKVHGKCVAPGGAGRRAPACTRTMTVAKFSHAGHTGANRLTFDGRLSGRVWLKPGHYTLLIDAAAAGQTSAAHELHFTIVGRAGT